MRKYVLTGALITSVISAGVAILRFTGHDLPVTDEQIATLGNALAGIGSIVFGLLYASASRTANTADVDRVGQADPGVGQKPAGPVQEGHSQRNTTELPSNDPFRDHGA
jgi:hypothetical protein